MAASTTAGKARPTPIRLLLADDHQVFRQGLRGLIENEPDMTVVGEAGSGREAIDLAHKFHPDVALVDIGMPDMNGIVAARAILKALPDVRVVGLTGFAERGYLLEFIRMGATGFVVKGVGFREVVRAIRIVHEGGTFVTGMVQEQMPEQAAARSPAAAARLPSLSAQENEVLRLLASDLSTKEIAAKLGIAPKTVETHERRMMLKLGVRSLDDLRNLARQARTCPGQDRPRR